MQATRQALEHHSAKRWVITYSGGKDSSAALKIVLTAAKRILTQLPQIDIVYCDTGVEGILPDRHAKTSLAKLEAELAEEALPVSIRILKAPVGNRFFVKIIGRGYPPPNTFFRWCTKNLRIRPVTEYLSSQGSRDAIVVTGMRLGESAQRDRYIRANRQGYWLDQNEGGKGQLLFCPIIDFSTEDVWDLLFASDFPTSLPGNEVWGLYKDSSGECPVIREPEPPPCGKGRFGCWTCTVVRRDKSSEFMIAAGHDELRPYLEFRSWLVSIRNQEDFRWAYRRNGSKGMGPFTLAARALILSRLQSLEECVGRNLVDSEELTEIFRLWELDHGVERLAS